MELPDLTLLALSPYVLSDPINGSLSNDVDVWAKVKEHVLEQSLTNTLKIKVSFEHTYEEGRNVVRLRATPEGMDRVVKLLTSHGRPHLAKYAREATRHFASYVKSDIADRVRWAIGTVRTQHTTPYSKYSEIMLVNASDYEFRALTDVDFETMYKHLDGMLTTHSVGLFANTSNWSRAIRDALNGCDIPGPVPIDAQRRSLGVSEWTVCAGAGEESDLKRSRVWYLEAEIATITRAALNASRG